MEDLEAFSHLRVATKSVTLQKLLVSKGWTEDSDDDGMDWVQRFVEPDNFSVSITTGPDTFHDAGAVFQALPEIVDQEILAYILEHPPSEDSLVHDYCGDIPFSALGKVVDVVE